MGRIGFGTLLASGCIAKAFTGAEWIMVLSDYPAFAGVLGTMKKGYGL